MDLSSTETTGIAQGKENDKTQHRDAPVGVDEERVLHLVQAPGNFLPSN